MQGREGLRGHAAKIKRTFYLDPTAVVALNEIQTEELRRTGRKPDLSQLVTLAILRLRGGKAPKAHDSRPRRALV